MIISFIGSSQSGKTTVASLVFSELKDLGLVCEYIPEQARYYIANKRVVNNLQPEDKISLSNEDQLNIMEKQLNVQEMFTKACGENVLIITDSSPFNSLLYMSEEFKEDPKVKDLIERTKSLKTKYFYSYPIDFNYHKQINIKDPNRVHTQEESMKIDKTIPDLLKLYNINAKTIEGNSTRRKELVFHSIHFDKKI